jgi:hypothetical protein
LRLIQANVRCVTISIFQHPVAAIVFLTLSGRAGLGAIGKS